MRLPDATGGCFAFAGSSTGGDNEIEGSKLTGDDVGIAINEPRLDPRPNFFFKADSSRAAAADLVASRASRSDESLPFLEEDLADRGDKRAPTGLLPDEETIAGGAGAMGGGAIDKEAE